MKINQENQFIDFRLITQSRKNHVLSCFVSNIKAAVRSGENQTFILLIRFSAVALRLSNSRNNISSNFFWNAF
ncbi:hypothetical protein AM380_08700 [Morganella morganii]|uniref:Uncharacterized protein n=1 Tax=Morganella morganii TaxID=582 RepID=A0AAU8ZLQ2_MORMO|nr:hypothetical protein AM380_08700 [Morganella morganii]